MSLIVSASSNSDFKLAPAGSHLAFCYRIVDLGTQTTEWKGKPKESRKVMFTWELHGEDSDGNPLLTDDGKPLMTSKRYSFSLSEKATLRAHLVGWRGREFTLDELNGFDLEKVLGNWCMVNIAHESRDGKTYANITGITGVPSVIKKAGLPEPVNKTLMFSLEKFDESVYNSFSDGIKQTIAKSPEYQNAVGKTTAKAATSLADIDDDVPF